MSSSKDWKDCILSDILTFQRGHDLPRTEMIDGEYPVVGSNGIIGYHNNYTTEEPSISIGRSGNVGKPFIYHGKTWSHNTTLYIKEYKNSDPYFVYYFLKMLDLGSYANGSAVPTLNRNHIHTIPIKVPPIPQQKRIAAILSALDDKIELNNSMNKNLEAQAQAIFKSWFVDFEPWSGVMPDGWREGTLGDICSYSKRRVAIEEIDVSRYFSTENMLPNKAGSIIASGLPTTSQTTACKQGDVLVSNIRPYFKKMVYCDIDGGCSSDVLCFEPTSNNYSLFIYQALYVDAFFDHMILGSKGTKMPRGDKQQIMQYSIVIPTFNVLNEFNKVIKPIIDRVTSNKYESQTLAVLRDSLLPKLMSGEIFLDEVLT